jgi:exopolysaccharide biosynthesis polyprenyl glycosylphosphotransferase
MHEVEAPHASPPTPATAGSPRPPEPESPRARRVPFDLVTAVAMGGDILMVTLGLLFGYWIRFESGWIPLHQTWWTSEADRNITVRQYAGLIAVGALFLLGSFLYNRLYDRRNLLRYRRVVLLVTRSATFWLFAYLSVSLVLRFQPPISRIYVVCSFLSVLAFVLGWRWLLHRVLEAEPVAAGLRQRVLFIGWSDEANRFHEAIEQDLNQPYQVIGCLPTSDRGVGIEPPARIPRLQVATSIEDIATTDTVDIVIVANPDMSRETIQLIAAACERQHLDFKVIPTYFQILISGLHLETISGVPILGVAELPLDRLHNRILKRTVDLVGGVVGLVLSAPIIAVFGALVYWESPGPIFYRQVRTGRNGQKFKIIKIRSMRLDAEAVTGARWAVKNDPRRLRVGRILREWNLDEVPQFWNVLRGEMSLVGPRPERPELIARFKYEIPHYNARHGAKPGITGWAQVHGLRGDTDLSQRVRYDLWYLENWSFWLDFQIMLMTFFNRKNAY